METQLTHPFKDKLPDVEEFFGEGICSVNEFCAKTEVLSAKYINQIKPNLFKGGMLELLVEYIMKTMSHDNRIGIYDYEPVLGEEDVGVDGKGKGENGFPATVQVKFRQGHRSLENNKDHLSNFLASSVFDYDVRKEDNKNMLIITTAAETYEFTKEIMLKSKVRILDREALREMLDNRQEWWKRFHETVKESRLRIVPIVNAPLRPHQEDGVTKAIDSLDAGKSKGMLIYPTGTGKTRIAAEIAYRIIQEEKAKGNFSPVIKFNSPRILLNFQLFDDVFKYLCGKGLQAKYVHFCSGNADDQEYVKVMRSSGNDVHEIVSTLTVMEVREAYGKAKKENLPLVAFSTYHSSEKFAETVGGSFSGTEAAPRLPIPSITIHDEAHNLVSREFSEAAKLPSNADLFFTATMKTTEDTDLGKGMNNEAIFGTAIEKVSAKAMIDRGEMVPPYIHIVTARRPASCKSFEPLDLDKLERSYDALVQSIGDAFLRHQKKIQEDSAVPAEIGAKVLVVCRGQEDLHQMFKSRVFEAFRQQYPKIHIFALSSDFGLYNDGEKLEPPVTWAKKQGFLRKVKALSPSEQCLIFHVDMIGEGIDVPGITGVMPFRNCDLVKFCQNIGRSSRLNIEDRKRFYANEITVDERNAQVTDGKTPNTTIKTWIKPCSWIIIPSFLEDAEGFGDRFRQIIHKLRDEYGYIPSQQVVIDNVRGLDEVTPVDGTGGQFRCLDCGHVWDSDTGYCPACKSHNITPRTRSGADAGEVDFEHEFEERTGLEKVFYEEAVADEIKKVRGEFAALAGGVSPVLAVPVPTIPNAEPDTSVIPITPVKTSPPQSDPVILRLFAVPDRFAQNAPIPIQVKQEPIAETTPNQEAIVSVSEPPPVKTGRTASKITDKAEVARIAAMYKGNGGTMTFEEIEELVDLDLRKAKGMTAYRICKNAKLIS